MDRAQDGVNYMESLLAVWCVKGVREEHTFDYNEAVVLMNRLDRALEEFRRGELEWDRVSQAYWKVSAQASKISGLIASETTQ